MNNKIITSLIITAIISLVGYFVGPYLFSSSQPSVTFAIGILVGGAIVSFLGYSSNIHESAEQDNTSNGDFTTLYVGNLAYKVNEKTVKEHFSAMGTVNSVRLMKDKRTGKRKGYGFVEIESSKAQDAISSLNETEFHERTMKVRLAKDKV